MEAKRFINSIPDTELLKAIEAIPKKSLAWDCITHWVPSLIAAL